MIMKVKNCFISIWSILDPLYYCLTRLKYLDEVKENRPIFRVRLTKYRGRNVKLDDGTVIKKGDLLIKIHLHNIRLLRETHEINSEIKKARKIFQEVKRSLPYLANYVSKHPRSEEIKGVVGITLLHKGCTRLGFETFTLKNPIYRYFKQFIGLPIYMLSTNSVNKNILSKLFPKYLFMSKDILEKYKV